MTNESISRLLSPQTYKDEKSGLVFASLTIKSLTKIKPLVGSICNLVVVMVATGQDNTSTIDSTKVDGSRDIAVSAPDRDLVELALEKKQAAVSELVKTLLDEANLKIVAACIYDSLRMNEDRPHVSEIEELLTPESLATFLTGMYKANTTFFGKEGTAKGKVEEVLAAVGLAKN